MSNFLRRVSLSRLIALCVATVVLAAGSTAIALAVTAGPTPPPQPLVDAIHSALQAPPPSGVSAHIELVDNLFEGSEILSSANGHASSPLLSGGSGRLWIGSEGQIRLELQSESGATQLIYDKGTLTVYDAASGKLYSYTPPAGEGIDGEEGAGSSKPASVPTVAQIEKELTRLMGSLDISGATPLDVAGEPAYSATLSPKRNGGLFGDAELAWDANNGVPLRFAIYAKGNATPAIELTVTEVSFGEVPSSTFSLSLPSGVKETTIRPAHHSGTGAKPGQGKPSFATTGLSAVQAAVPFTLQAPATLGGMQRDEVRLVEYDGTKAAFVGYGEGLGGIVVIETAAKDGKEDASGSSSSSPSSQLPTPTIDGAKATEIPTELGSAIGFESGGVQHFLFGSVTASTIEAAARGL